MDNNIFGSVNFYLGGSFCFYNELVISLVVGIIVIVEGLIVS